MTECDPMFILQNVKKGILALPAAQDAGTVQMEKPVINTAGDAMAVAYHSS